jgi:hypothetical protein
VSASTQANVAPGDDGARESGLFTVWRKVEYELETMLRFSGGDYSDRANTTDMVAKLADLFIEVVAVGHDDHPPHQRIVTETEADHWSARYRQGGGHTYYQLALIDTIAWSPATQRADYNVTASPFQVDIDGDLHTLDPRQWWPDAGFSASYRDAHGNRRNLTRAQVTLTETNDGYTLAIDLSATGLTPSTASPVVVRVAFKEWTSGSGLQVSNSTTYIGVRWREKTYSGSASDVIASCLNTMLHEPGHAMGMASSSFEDGSHCATAYAKQGEHCMHPFTSHADGTLDYDCVMYEANGTSDAHGHQRTPHTDFCDNCKRALRGRLLHHLPVDGTSSMVVPFA